ncbi:MAG: O-antigen ligase family protein [Vicinamibacterales bacterium]
MKIHGTLLLLTVGWGAVAFGAVYPWAYWPLAIACALLGIAGFRRSPSPIRSVPAAGGWLGVFAVGVLVQLAPLPRQILLRVNASADAFLGQYYLAYALNPSAWHPLSIVPVATWVGLGLFTALALFLVGTSRALSRLDLETIVRRLMLLAVALGLFGVVQKALHGDDPGVPYLIYGFWRPREGGSPFGPFVNRNHFAGWMLMALPLVLGYGIGLFERVRPRRGGWGAWFRWLVASETGPLMLAALSVLATGTALALTGSRSGIVSFAAAVVIMAAFVLRAVRRRSARLAAMALAGLLVVGAIAWAGSGATIQRFSAAGRDLEGRFAGWRDTAHIIHEFPVFGTGLNTYGYAMLVYQTSDRRLFYREAHNDYLQLIAEGGVLLTVPAALALAMFARDVRRRFRDGADDPMTHWIRVGAVAGLGGIAIQSIMEFSLQMPGNAVLFTLVAAIAVHRPAR